MTREFTGWHMLGLMVGGFGIIIAVNLTLAWNAIATFPGLETRNSYVISQSFQADRAAQNEKMPYKMIQWKTLQGVKNNS